LKKCYWFDEVSGLKFSSLSLSGVLGGRGSKFSSLSLSGGVVVLLGGGGELTLLSILVVHTISFP
jgi:hypothetical protein